MMLPEPAGLRRFISENWRSQIIHLAGKRFRVKIAFKKCTNRTGSPFRLERNGTFSLVFEGIHFLLDNIGRISNASCKQFRMFKNRGSDLSEAGFRCRSAHFGFQILPAVAFGRQYIFRPSWCLCKHAFPPLCHPIRKKSPCRTLHGAMTRCATLASRTLSVSKPLSQACVRFSPEGSGLSPCGLHRKLSA